MAKKLHKIQKKIIDLFKENENKLPSFRKIAKEIGVSSTNTVAYHVQILKERGYFLLPSSLENGIIPLNLRAILHLSRIGGVYVLLRADKGLNTPIFVGESGDMKQHILEQISSNPCLEKIISDDLETLSLAFYAIGDDASRKKLADDLRLSYADHNLC